MPATISSAPAPASAETAVAPTTNSAQTVATRKLPWRPANTPPMKVVSIPTTQAAVAYRPSVAASMPMRGAITAGAIKAQEVSICSAVIAASAGSSGTGFESEGAGDSIRLAAGGGDGGRDFGSCGRCIARQAGAPHAGGDLFARRHTQGDRGRQA